MAETTLVLIAVPGGPGPGDPGLRRLSVAVFPRLAGGAVLADFPGMLAWTQRLVDGGPTLYFDIDGQPWSAAVDTGGLRPDLWEALLRPDLPVNDFAIDDFRGHTVRSSPTAVLAGLVQESYADIGLYSPARVPTARQVSEVTGRLRHGEPDPAVFDEDRRHWDLGGVGLADREPLEARRRQELATNPPTVDEALRRFRAVREPGRADRSDRPWPGRPDPRATSDRLDVHGVLAALAHHPALLRALGLVFDLTIPDDGPALGPPAPGDFYPTIALRRWSLPEPQLPDGDVEALALPRTAVDAADRAFLPAPTVRAGDVPRGGVYQGAVLLDPALWSVVPLDVEGAVTKLLSLAERDPAGTAAPDVGVGLPALRSDGLGLASLTQAAEALLAFDRAARIDAALRGAGPEEVLTAAHLTQGYRADVWRESRNSWFSLHRRAQEYDVGGIAWPAEDEGFATAALAQPPEPHRTLDTAEVLVRWTGWSLSVPRPVQPIGREVVPGSAGTEPEGAPPATSPLRVVTSRPAPRSLPGLRFGDRYRVRLRAVDVGGGGLLPDAGSAGAGLPVEPVGRRYLRFEPVAAPVIVTAGATPRLVIDSANLSPADDLVPTAATAVAHLLPPKATVDLVERHGCLDDATGRPRPAAAVHALLAARDVAVDRAATIDDPGIPHLPDPLARGVVLRGLPGVPDGWFGTVDAAGVLRFDENLPIPFDGAEAGAVALPFTGAWPDPVPVKVALVEGSGLPTWDHAQRTLTVGLAKGRRADVAVSSLLGAGDLALLGVWEWFAARLDRDVAAAAGFGGSVVAGDALTDRVATRAHITRLALEGGHWALTPAATLRLVHQVAQPVGAPSLRRFTERDHLPEPDPGTGPFDVVRAAGAHTAELTGGLLVDLPSTGSVTVRAAWTDPVDVPALGPPSRAQRDEAVGRVEIPEGAGVGDLLDAPGTQPTMVVGAGALAWSGEGRIAAVDVARSCPLVHTIGDTRHHLVRYRAQAVSRDAAEQPAGTETTRTSDPVEVHVPSCARPDPPVVVEVVPAFAWDRQHSTDVRTSVRQGRTVRVYLERPWFSSGDDELLGVVCLPAAEALGPRLCNLRDRVSLWGLDGLHGGGDLVPDAPRRWSFPEAVAGADGVYLRQFQRSVDIAGHTVHYDAGTDRWFADVVLDAKLAYTPFVRLVLVRFQPYSVPGREISAPVVVDHLQLSPDRAVTVATLPDDPHRRRVVVTGVGPAAVGIGFGARSFRTGVTVAVEQAAPDLGPELGWEPAPASVATVAGAAQSPPTQAVLWRGEVHLADPAGAGLRLLVTEREYYPSGDGRLPVIFGGLLTGVVPTASRIVFAEAIPLG